MKTLCTSLMVVLSIGAALAQQTNANGPVSLLQQTSSSNKTDNDSAAEITRAQQEVAAHPENADAYTSLALTLVEHAKQTQNSAMYARADLAIDQALQIAPRNFEGEKARVVVALGRHDFARARDLATSLNKREPDDIAVYGFLVDANMAIGNYDEAENAAQWMLNLRPGNIPALIRTAELRDVFGDHEGAIEVLRLILDSTIASDGENRAWAFSQIGRLDIEEGKLDTAEGALKQAVSLAPDGADCLRMMARLRLAQKLPAGAADLLRSSYKAAPRVETLYELGNALEAAGRKNEATQTFDDFEQKALAEAANPDNANHALVFYYADHARKPGEALRIARIEAARLHDVHTLDALAWAFYVNGQYTEARQQMDLVLKVGAREAPVFYHAGRIAAKLGDSAQAAHHFRMAADLNSTKSNEAAQALAELKQPGSSRPK